MTSYITITDAETDPEAPLTSELAKKWRDNPIAIAEKDATVPVPLRLGTWLLGTINTTSGTTQTLSGLDLTNVSSLIFIVQGVGDNSTTNGTLSIENLIIDGTDTVAGNRIYSRVDWDLATGYGTIVTSTSTLSPPLRIGAPSTILFAGQTGITNASTSISATMATTTFAAGSIRVYGVR